VGLPFFFVRPAGRTDWLVQVQCRPGNPASTKSNLCPDGARREQRGDRHQWAGNEALGQTMAHLRDNSGRLVELCTPMP